jgi:uncharacterized membrane protein
MRSSLIISWIVVVIALILSLAFYSQVPDRVDSHWDGQGRVNGTMSRFWGMFLLPLMMGGLTLLLIWLPKIDPLRPNFTGFQKQYYGFILAFNLFMLLVHIYMILWNTEITRFNPMSMISIGVGMLLYAAGVMIKNSKRNWFAGIRTPWTLSSENVWDKTHQLGSYLFKAVGVLIGFSIFIPRFSIGLILFSSIGISLILVIYSYIAYRQEQKSST